MHFNSLNLELTTFCNSSCRFCVRTRDIENGGFKLVNIDWEVIEKIPFNEFELILLLGSRGDSIFYPKLFEVIKYIENKSPNSTLAIHTNGSFHDDNWWNKLAKHMNYNPKNSVIFAVDGLEDTHSIYRKGTDFNKIIKNIKTYTKSAGKAIVQYLIFKHNHHQMSEAKKIFVEIGVSKIWWRPSRGYNNEFESPDNSKIELEKSEVVCDYFDNSSLFIGADGQITPCCFMGAYNKTNIEEYLKKDIRKLSYLLAYVKSPKSINLKYFTFDEILKSNYFKAIQKDYKHLFICNDVCTVACRNRVSINKEKI